jgi:predicted nucleotidyltransferase
MRRSHLISPEIIMLLTKVFRNVRWYMIGANAINMNFELREESEMRVTEDIDLAVYLNGYQEFETIKQDLIEHDFKWNGSRPYRFTQETDSLILDIIPFGGISSGDEIEFYDSKVRLSVKGLKEMMGETVLVSMDDNVRFHLASLDALAVLKLISWNERPEWRGKDLEDFLYILDKYFDLHSNEIFEEYNYLFHPESDNMKIIGARVMGIKLKSILTAHGPLFSDLNNIIDKNICDSDQWSKVYAIHFNVPADIALDILIAFKEAFKQ